MHLDAKGLSKRLFLWVCAQGVQWGRARRTCEGMRGGRAISNFLRLCTITIFGIAFSSGDIPVNCHKCHISNKWLLSPRWKVQFPMRPFLFQLDFALATFFVVYFFIRMIAADDKLLFLFQRETIVDFFTVPPVFLSGIVNHEKVPFICNQCHVLQCIWVCIGSVYVVFGPLF